MENNPLWTIAVCTTLDRRNLFLVLKNEFERQIDENNLRDKVEFIFEEDDKSISVGAKSQILLERAKGLFWNRFDSDDWPYHDYVKTIYETIVNNPDIDCIGFPIDMTTNGRNPQRCCHSLRYPVWMDKYDGWDYVRNCSHFNPALRSKALQVGFKDMRIFEDKDYSDRISAILSNEFYIDRPLFHYRYSSLIPASKKYGITK